METTTTFRADDAVAVAEAAVRDRFKEVRRQAEDEATVAIAAVDRYAKHLADGGDPREGFERENRYARSTSYISSQTFLEVVYREWDAARGSRNPFSPIASLQSWEIAEYGLARVGEPVTFAEYGTVAPAQRRYATLQTDDVARALAACQGDDLVLRRTKVDGKVAYLLRERRPGEEFVGKRSENDPTRVSILGRNVPQETREAR